MGTAACSVQTSVAAARPAAQHAPPSIDPLALLRTLTLPAIRSPAALIASFTATMAGSL